MSIHEPPIVLRNALRTLADQARAEAALLDICDPEHAFYSGVVTAAEDRLRPHVADIHDEVWLARESRPFRDGYLKASNVIANAEPNQLRFMLPTYDSV